MALLIAFRHVYCSLNKMMSDFISSVNSILLVDDNELLLSGMKRFCERESYRVATATTGKEALERIRTGLFPVVILDVNLPDMNGCEVLELIKGFSPESMVVMITSDANEKLRQDAFMKGASEFLEKPFAVQSLRAVLSRLKSIRGRISSCDTEENRS
jgi:DNA-binding response OmpR family regulator